MSAQLGLLKATPHYFFKCYCTNFSSTGTPIWNT